MSRNKKTLWHLNKNCLYLTLVSNSSPLKWGINFIFHMPERFFIIHSYCAFPNLKFVLDMQSFAAAAGARVIFNFPA
jgi:hypothetical protein